MRTVAALSIVVTLLAFTALPVAVAEGMKVDGLIRELKSGNLQQQIKAAEALKDLGPLAAPAVPALVEALNDKNPGLQHEALMTLERIGPAARGAVGDLIKLLENKDKSRLHSGAIDALATIGRDAEKAVPLLKRLLAGKDSHLATAAGLALTQILPAGSDQLAEVVPILVKSLANSSPEIRNEAVFGLGACGRKAIPELTKLVEAHQKSPELAWQAATALAMTGREAEPALPGLIDALKSKHENVVTSSADALGAIGPRAKAAVSGLQELLSHSNPIVREHAANALGNFGQAAEPAVSDLAKLLKDDNEDVRRIAAGALGRMGTSAETAIPALIAALDDDRGPVALHAAEALAQIGPYTIPHLSKVLSDPRRQHLAVMILAEMGPAAKDAVGELSAALAEHHARQGQDDSYHEFCREILMTLARMGPAAKEAVPALLKILADEKHGLRSGAAWALANIGAKEAIPFLHKALETDVGSRLHLVAPIALMLLEPNNEEYVRMAVPNLASALENKSGAIRREAAATLARIGPKAAPAVEKLTAVLGDPDPTIRNAALVALASIGPESTGAVAPIMAQLNEPSYPLRYSAVFALGKIGRTARQSIPVLEKNLQDPDDFLQTASAWALLQIDPKGERRAAQCLKPLINGLAIPDPLVRKEVIQGLGLLGPAAKPAAKTLKEMSKDPNEAVRKSVAEALAKIEG
jgi:HEAT repeat protein